MSDMFEIWSDTVSLGLMRLRHFQIHNASQIILPKPITNQLRPPPQMASHKVLATTIQRGNYTSVFFNNLREPKPSNLTREADTTKSITTSKHQYSVHLHSAIGLQHHMVSSQQASF